MNWHKQNTSMAFNLLYTVFLSTFVVLHDFHVSICDIEHNPESKALQISQRIFIDDLEAGLKAFHNLEMVDTYKPEDTHRLDSLMEVYFAKKLFISIDGSLKPFKYLGSELEGDARWAYLEVEGISNFKEVEVSNLILLEAFDDQENIVHFKANGKLRSYRLNKREKAITFQYE